MDRTGIIVSVDKEFSRIKLLRHTACGNCGACQLGDDQKDVMLIAKNDVHVEVGDMVEVSMGTSSVLSAAFIMYMIPLFAMFIGLVLGLSGLESLGYTGNVEVASALLGLLFMAITFLVIRMNDQRFLKSDKYTAHIEAVVQRANETLYPFS